MGRIDDIVQRFRYGTVTALVYEAGQFFGDKAHEIAWMLNAVKIGDLPGDVSKFCKILEETGRRPLIPGQLPGISGVM